MTDQRPWADPMSRIRALANDLYGADADADHEALFSLLVAVATELRTEYQLDGDERPNESIVIGLAENLDENDGRRVRA